MRVLHVITDPSRRGAQLFAIDLSEALLARGFASSVVALTDGPDPVPLRVETLGSSRYSMMSILRLRRAMKAVDITVGHGSDTVTACALASAGLKAQYVIRQISDVRFWNSLALRRLRSTVLLRSASSIVALSEFDQDELVTILRVPNRKIVVIPNAVVGSKFPPGVSLGHHGNGSTESADRETLRLLFVGALTTEKGADILVEAVQSLSGVSLRIAGDGPIFEDLRHLVRHSSNPDISLLGSVADVSNLYLNSDVVVLSCRGGDSMPACLIEAAMCERPAIASRVGAIPEIVQDGLSGILVEPGDIEGLRAAILRFRDDKSLISVMGSEARRHCTASFDIETVADQWASHLESVSSGDFD